LLSNGRDAGRNGVVAEAFRLREDEDREGRRQRRWPTRRRRVRAAARAARQGEREPHEPYEPHELYELYEPHEPTDFLSELFLHRIQNSVDEFHGLFAAERLRQLEGFVDDDVTGRG